MAVKVKCFAKSFTFGLTTWTESSGGPLEVDFSPGRANKVVSDAVADQMTPSFWGFSDKQVRCRVTLRDPTITPPTIGASGATSMVLTDKASGTEDTVSLGTLYYVGAETNQPHADPAGITLEFVGPTA